MGKAFSLWRLNGVNAKRPPVQIPLSPPESQVIGCKKVQNVDFHFFALFVFMQCDANKCIVQV
jgi:hypothetical protein